MKKTLLAMVSLFLSMGAFADEVTFNFTGESAYGMTLLSGNTSEYNSDPTTCTEGGVTLTLNGKTRWWKVTDGNQLRFYTGSSMDVAAPKGNIVTSVVLATKGASSFETSVGTYDNGTWTGSAQTASISCNLTKGNAGVTTITVTYQKSDAPVKKNPGLSFSETAVSAVLGEAFTAPTLTKETTAEIVYSSSDEDVAKVDATTGAVTLLSRGTVEITATAAENDEYSAGTAKYTLDVTSTTQNVVPLPYSETFESGLGEFLIHDEVLGEGLTYVWKYDSTNKYVKASAYVKKNIPSESYVVSPWFVIPADATNCTLTFDQCVNKYFGTLSEEAQLLIYKENQTSDALAITYPEIKENSNWSNFETQTVDLTAYKGQKIIVAFKYVSTSDNAGTWEIKNFNVTSDGTNSIDDVNAEKVNVNAPVYNLAGQRVNANAKGILIQNGKKFVK